MDTSNHDKGSFINLRDIDGRILGKDGKPLKPILKPRRGAPIAKPSDEIIRVSQDATNENPKTLDSIKKSQLPIPTQATSLAVNVETDNFWGTPDVIGNTSSQTLNQTKEKVSFAFVGMENVLENGPWLIRRVPLILNKWTPDTILKKDEIKRVPVWVKMHHVPIVAYSDIGLSLITTQIGKPIMLDSYTSLDASLFYKDKTYNKGYSIRQINSAENRSPNDGYGVLSTNRYAVSGIFATPPRHSHHYGNLTTLDSHLHRTTIRVRLAFHHKGVFVAVVNTRKGNAARVRLDLGSAATEVCLGDQENRRGMFGLAGKPIRVHLD
nr:zinc knuckle CX2CX4HX4C [Tanacetum cinerariifolium]